jgi:hypothetical protein
MEPIELDIGPEGKEETFLAIPMILGVDLIDLLAGIDSDNTGEAAAAIKKLFEIAIVEDDRERFNKFLADKDNFVDPETLMDIAISLAEEYLGGTPTEPEQSSSNGSVPSDSGSKAGSSRRKAPASKA